MDMKVPVEQRLFLTLLSIFAIFAASLILFQQSREREYKREAMNSRLQQYNFRIYESLPRDSAQWEKVASLIGKLPSNNLRLTIIDPQGNVEYDSEHSDISNIGNHLDRSEIQQALSVGAGNDYDRNSSTTGRKYFYSATYFPEDSIIVRTALPYDTELIESLKADQHYLWFALFLMCVMGFILWKFLSRLGKNIDSLQNFAQKADHNEELTDKEINSFHNDELGDIARRIVRLYKKLKDTQEQQTRLKRELTQNVAHELKTPVASIHGYMETLLSNPDIPADTRRQFMERCFAQTKRLSSLIQDISALNRLDDTTSTSLTKEPIDINALVTNIMNDTALQRGEHNIEFKNKLAANITVKGEYSLVYSIFRNLTDNAIAYAGDGSTIELKARETQSSWYFEFSDNGVGVPEECLLRLFERFYRVDKGRSRSMGGTGLGLAIVKNAVIRHGGIINVTNRKGGGLIFLFSLRK